MEILHEETHKGYKIKIWPDGDLQNPRENDNLGTFICAHRNYRLGDEQVMPDEAMPRVARIKEEGGLVLPIYMYDHSGLAFSFSNEHYPFNDRFDAGMLGFAYVEASKLRDEMGVSELDSGVLERAQKILEGELEEYQAYVGGHGCGYTVYDSTGGELDCCGGYYDMKYALEEAKGVVDAQ